MSSPEINLLKGPMPELSKMKAKDIKIECEMWRNLWGWIPPEVKYYIARVGQDLAITMRNYKRYLGVLVDTHWELVKIELGCTDKVYDPVKDQTFFEKKVILVDQNSIIDFQWIKERKSWEDFQAEATDVAKVKPEDNEQPTTTTTTI